MRILMLNQIPDDIVLMFKNIELSRRVETDWVGIVQHESTHLIDSVLVLLHYMPERTRSEWAIAAECV